MSNWVAQLSEATDFLIVIGGDYCFKSAQMHLQKEEAKRLRKPFRVAIKNGVEIPDGYYDGIEDIVFEGFSDESDFLAAVERLMGGPIEGCQIIDGNPEDPRS